MNPPPRKLGLKGFWHALWDSPRALIFGGWFTLFPFFFLTLALPVTATMPKEPDHAKI